MSGQLSGKTALVTGGGAGIGRATALAFAKAGVNLMIGDIDTAGAEQTCVQIRALGVEAEFRRCDVRSDADVATLVRDTVARFGSLDYAFNNAGIEIENSRLVDGKEDTFDAIMAVNVKGVWLCMKHEIAQMLKQGSGAIVNVASIAGLLAAPRMSIYAASKHAVIGLTKSAAVEYAKKNIRINAVCPAVIETEMYRRAAAQDPRTAEMAAKLHPVGRLGQVEEIAGGVMYLCSDAAGFTTGHSLVLDGGATIV